MSTRMLRNRNISTRRREGFTLIEVMIVVAIIAILSAIAMPSYTRHVQRGRLTEATSKLADLRTRMEQYFQDKRNYGISGTGCGVAAAASNSGYFTFTCYLTNDPAVTTQTDDQSFVLHAVGASTMTGFEYTINQSSAKQTRSFVGASGLPAACWLLRSGDVC